MNDEFLGTADIQEVTQIKHLLVEKQTELLSIEWREGIATLEIEDSDILSDDSLDQIFMDYDKNDSEDSIEMVISEQGTVYSINEESLPLRRVEVKDFSYGLIGLWLLLICFSIAKTLEKTGQSNF
ncbi:hypothetical protein TSTA_078960 [Talaromyces stipitatus ATCC 10500]|uniref:Uncharacterized protein n=1 Tax=Talaromyces stipitatus (strain ATCC 10500 / CBS 375.48 / QM 6759 / NRRL 1006) TaxID=441959 RepID=B8LXN8_TALSN|nr:uncharacterized protein TSTA_078960 [Talaromyces stipitatus ATCC 10500]EED24539.1 hypothetical protein TSTA_078960 [Talaromyces stipitatus ATCC 10500]